MRFKVYYLNLTEAQRSQVNNGGEWSCPAGAAYLAAKHRENDTAALRPAIELGMVSHAATVEVDDHPDNDHMLENVWQTLQNGHRSWATCSDLTTKVTAHTTFTRSCDVGDLIFCELTSDVYRVESCGFAPLHGDNLNAFESNFHG